MILGIGTDIVNIERIENVFKRHGERFLKRIYTATERAEALRRADSIGFLAKRWAAKEACSKALGTGMKQGVAWRDIEILTRRSGMPLLTLSGGAGRQLERLLPAEYVAFLHVTMTDDRPCASAYVVIEVSRRDLSSDGLLMRPSDG